MQLGTLKFTASDDQLDELTSICNDLKTLDTLNGDLAITDSTLAMLLQLLDAAGEHSTSP